MCLFFAVPKVLSTEWSRAMPGFAVRIDRGEQDVLLLQAEHSCPPRILQTEIDDMWSVKDESVTGTPIREAEEASDAAILAALKPPAVKVLLPPAEEALYESQQVSSCLILFSIVYSCGSPWPWACCAVVCVCL
jgi:hypothetical protein